MKTSETLEFGAFVLDRAARTLRCGGRDVPIPSRSFDVLLALVERRGTVVSKETLRAAAWGAVAVEENTVTQAVSALRRAIRDASGDDSVIVTIPAQGYQFTAGVRARRVFRRGPLVMAALFTVVVLGFAVIQRFHPLHWWEEHCVAVVQFETLGQPAAAGAALADGIIVKLAAVDHLRVRPTSSIAGLPAGDVRRLGAALKVDRIISGTIQTTREGIRVTVRLIDVNKEAAVWGATFDEPSRGQPPSDRLLSRIADSVRPRLGL